MFIKILNEPGQYIHNDTNECVNILIGNEIYTQNGKVTTDNLQGFQYYTNFDEALIDLNLTKITEENGTKY